MKQLLNCPRCGAQPEKDYKYDRKTAVRFRCPECGATAGGSFLGGYVTEDPDHCATDVAAKNWNDAVKYELKKRAKESSHEQN